MTKPTFGILTFDQVSEISTLYQQIESLKWQCFNGVNMSATEWDHFEKNAFHLVMAEDNRLLAYCRVCPPHTYLPCASFSRVSVQPDLQKNGFGKIIVNNAINFIGSNLDNHVQIVVRRALLGYYKKWGFVVDNNVNSRNNIYHLMTKSLKVMEPSNI